MIDPKLKKIEAIDDDWQQLSRTSGVVRDRADQVRGNAAPDLPRNLLRMSGAEIAERRLFGKTG
jgi:hypothetical protein